MPGPACLELGDHGILRLQLKGFRLNVQLTGKCLRMRLLQLLGTSERLAADIHQLPPTADSVMSRLLEHRQLETGVFNCAYYSNLCTRITELRKECKKLS